MVHALEHCHRYNYTSSTEVHWYNSNLMDGCTQRLAQHYTGILSQLAQLQQVKASNGLETHGHDGGGGWKGVGDHQILYPIQIMEMPHHLPLLNFPIPSPDKRGNSLLFERRSVPFLLAFCGGLSVFYFIWLLPWKFIFALFSHCFCFCLCWNDCCQRNCSYAPCSAVVFDCLHCDFLLLLPPLLWVSHLMLVF